MIGPLVVGLLAGAGLLLIVTGLVPAPPPLVRELANLHRRPTPQPATGERRSRAELLGRRLTGIAWAQRLSAAVASNLRITDTTAAAHIGHRAVAASAGLLTPTVFAAALWAGGVDVGLALPVWTGIPAAALGFVYPGLALKSRAGDRRRSFRHALSAFLDVVSISLAGGRGVDTALRDAAAAGREWPFHLVQAALLEARLTGQPPWAGLAQLGTDIGIPELNELAASAALAGDEGARVRSSLAAKARSLRLRGLTDVEAAANSASETMSIPVVLLMAGFVVFLGFPAVVRVLQGI